MLSLIALTAKCPNSCQGVSSLINSGLNTISPVVKFTLPISFKSVSHFQVTPGNLATNLFKTSVYCLMFGLFSAWISLKFLWNILESNDNTSPSTKNSFADSIFCIRPASSFLRFSWISNNSSSALISSSSRVSMASKKGLAYLPDKSNSTSICPLYNCLTVAGGL